MEKDKEKLSTRNGKRVARMVPEAGRIDKVQALAAVERMRERAKTLEAGLDWECLKAAQDAERP
jgi:hypothetical protein